MLSAKIETASDAWYSVLDREGGKEAELWFRGRLHKLVSSKNRRLLCQHIRDWLGGSSRSARQYFRALNRFSSILGGASVKPARIRSSPTQCSGTRQAADRVVLRWPLWENLTDTYACHGGI